MYLRFATIRLKDLNYSQSYSVYVIRDLVKNKGLFLINSIKYIYINKERFIISSLYFNVSEDKLRVEKYAQHKFKFNKFYRVKIKK